MSFLQGNIDRHNGLHIFEFHENSIKEDLKKTIEESKNKGISSIWIYMSKGKISNIKEPLDLGFDMHHCKENIIVLNKWLLEIENKIPPYGTHQMGVAG